MPGVIELEIGNVGNTERVTGTDKLGEPELLVRTKGSLSVILCEQHPQTGLFPAATKDRYDSKYHYDHTWFRDNAMVAIALLDPALSKVLSAGETAGIQTSATRSIKGMLDLCGTEPWQSAFQQEVENVQENGNAYRRLTREPPPIHLQTNGSPCETWPSQNQPDSWGELLIATDLMSQQGVFLNTKQQGTIEAITKYLLKIDTSSLLQNSMWEDGEVYNPSPTSSVAIVAKGLAAIAPYVSLELRGSIKPHVKSLMDFVKTTYPGDHTHPFNHRSATDLATLVGHGLGAFPYVRLDPYLQKVHEELGDGQYPGTRRYVGDDYHAYQGREAVWPMGSLLQAKIFLQTSIYLYHNPKTIDTAGEFRGKGLELLQKVINVCDAWGYNPELLKQTDEGLVPNENHLLWNEALMALVCARAIIAGRLASETSAL